MPKVNIPLQALKNAGAKDGKLPQNHTVMIQGTPTQLYMGPENGPFECQNCEYFHSPHSCEKVSGTIDPKGCCSFFEPEED